jgi:hypothetical protein
MSESNQTHARLSASGAHRWINCTPSVKAEERYPETRSEYAEEGRLAHEFAELRILKFISPMGQGEYNSRLKALQTKPLYQPEMLGHAETYFDHIAKIAHSFTSAPYIAVEKRVNFGQYVPDGFGTCDCVMIGTNTLYVFDYKYGKGVPVSAERNPQMMLYALGAYDSYSFLFAIDRVVMTIVQPRLDDGISSFEMSVTDLLAWGESIKPIAQQAYNGEGEFKSGEWCRFCRAKALCRARADFNLSLESYNRAKPPALSNAEVGEILKRAEDLAAWAKDLKEYALTELLKGGEVSGWKAVEGKSNRAFTDTDKVVKAVTAAGYDEALCYKREPLTLTKFEELLGKADFKKILSGFVIKPPGKPTLAPESDKREAITRMTAEQAFGNAMNG